MGVDDTNPNQDTGCWCTDGISGYAVESSGDCHSATYHACGEKPVTDEKPVDDTNPNQDTGCWCTDGISGYAVESSGDCSSADGNIWYVANGMSPYACGEKPATDEKPVDDTNPNHEKEDYGSDSGSSDNDGSDDNNDGDGGSGKGTCMVEADCGVTSDPYCGYSCMEGKCAMWCAGGETGGGGDLQWPTDVTDGNNGENKASGDTTCATKCGPGTMQMGSECVGIAGTCAGLWGDKVAHYRPEDVCQCNDKCKAYGNCCMDYKGAKGETCADRGCPQYYNPSWKCQCNGLCKQYGNCCKDSTRCSAPAP